MAQRRAGYQVGDTVGIDHSKCPGKWKIISFGPKNAIVESEQGGMQIRVSPSLFIDPDAVTSSPVLHVAGKLVEIPDGKYAGLYVVLSDTGGPTIKVAKLGGDGGRIVRALRRNLVEVDPESVLRNEDADKEWLR